ncbi:hypothetical protein CGRA01v4_08410 [Colletotrichum graminicola]|nr:hypothetical protein CGRA01v4_08410 [Colletotrichum graminicola]
MAGNFGSSNTARNNGHSDHGEDRKVADQSERWFMELCEMKRLFICCDGTWQNASGTITPLTNVAKLARAVIRLGNDYYEHPDPKEAEDVRRLARDDVDRLYDTYYPKDTKARVGLVRQLVYYSSGIGGQTAIQLERGYSGMTGKGLEANILNAYCFICNNFNFTSEKDEIILVGFSRGAFAVRCLANFIDKVGLLRRKGLTFLRPLFGSWKRWGGAKGNKKAKFQAEFYHMLHALEDLRYSDATVRILAEWDSVSAIGLPLCVPGAAGSPAALRSRN